MVDWVSVVSRPWLFVSSLHHITSHFSHYLKWLGANPFSIPCIVCWSELQQVVFVDKEGCVAWCYVDLSQLLFPLAPSYNVFKSQGWEKLQTFYFMLTSLPKLEVRAGILKWIYQVTFVGNVPLSVNWWLTCFKKSKKFGEMFLFSFLLKVGL